MTVADLIKVLDLKVLSGESLENKNVEGCYVGDLLSHVMSKASKNNLWVTVQTNVNILAVASLTEVSCIIIPEEIVVDEQTVQKAKAEDIILLSSKDSAAEIIWKYQNEALL